MSDDRPPEDKPSEAQPSSVPGLSRQEMLHKVVQRAKVAGALTATAAIADSFIAPPAHAQSSTNQFHDTNQMVDSTNQIVDTGGP